ncbi:Signal peptidase complex subunit 2 [Nakaseomyces bracarensis]|uniref:Signal peptidase complex subunit 2 n=1 Tax=Nakaseomyces bracarensis TaxID=273131 RepID=A0ABR4NU89_9SACH
MSKRINVYSSSEAAQTLDEMLPSVFSRLGYKEDHTFLDIKLVFGYTMSLLAVGSFLLDKKFAYKETLNYQVILTVTYFTLSLCLYIYNKTVVKGTTYAGVSKDGKKVKVCTSIGNADPNYKVTIDRSDRKSSLSTVLPINTVFTVNGTLQNEILVNWFKDQLADKSE